MCSDILFLLPALSRELGHFGCLSPKCELESGLNCVLLEIHLGFSRDLQR